MSKRLIYEDGVMSKYEPVDFDGDDDMLPDGVELWTVDPSLPPPLQVDLRTHTAKLVTVEDRATKTRSFAWEVTERPAEEVVAAERAALVKSLGGNLRVQIELDRENRVRALESQAPLTVDQYLDQISQQVNA